MNIIALINPAAGGVSVDGQDRIRQALAASGVVAARVLELDPKAGDAQLLDLAAQEPDLLVVWGGDGTHRSALKTLGQGRIGLALLPGGTMNLLSKSLHGHKPWNVILRDIIARPVRRTLPGGRVGDEPFYCAMLAGAPARFAEARESLRHGQIFEAVGRARAALETVNSLHLKARYGGVAGSVEAELPSSSIIGAMVGPTSRNGRMEVASMSQVSSASGLDVVWSSLHSGWRNLPGLTVMSAETLTVESEDGAAIPVILDGEAIAVGDSIRVTYVENAAHCLSAG